MRNKRLIIIFSVLCGLTLLIIVNSILFSVQHLQAYCFNDEDAALDSVVLSSSGIKTGKSIFFLNEDEIIKNVESSVPDKNVRVVNIERKFPNRVYINYVRILKYFRVVSGGNVYYLSNDCVVMSILSERDDGLAAAEDGYEPTITVRIKGEIENTNVGGELISTEPSDVIALRAIADALGKVMLKGTAVGIFESVEFSGQSKDTKNFIYFHTVTGAYWELQNSTNVDKKLQLAWDVYRQHSAYQASGTFIMYESSGKAQVSYTPANRYRDGI